MMLAHRELVAINIKLSKMRRTFLLAILTLFSNLTYSQNITQSTFYTSLNRSMSLSNRSSYQGRNEFHSIRLNTNAKGEVISYETSVSMAEVLQKDFVRAYQSLDKAGLVSYKFKNKVLILPFIILNGPIVPLEEQMWKFRTDDPRKKRKEILLPPFIFFLSSYKSIDN